MYVSIVRVPGVCNDIADQNFFLSSERSIPTHFFKFWFVYNLHNLLYKAEDPVAYLDHFDW